MKITFNDLAGRGYASVTDYCRFLMKENEELYADQSIEVFRGDMLCLTVSSVRYGATVDPTGSRWVPHDHRRQSKGRGFV